MQFLQLPGHETGCVLESACRASSPEHSTWTCRRITSSVAPLELKGTQNGLQIHIDLAQAQAPTQHTSRARPPHRTDECPQFVALFDLDIHIHVHIHAT